MSTFFKYRIWDEKYNCWDDVPITCYPYEDFKKQGRIVQWYTGLKDKTGKEIYQGDIVNYKINNNFIIAEVVWKDFGWCIIDKSGNCILFCYLVAEELEIIDSIFQLKKKKNEDVRHNKKFRLENHF